MSYKNAEILTDKNGKPIPQKFDESINDFISETTDSVQKTEVINTPADYPDKNVKAELELIKQGIADNKATNDLILARLDNPIDTQVTGSNVVQDTNIVQSIFAEDLEAFHGQTITGGSRFELILKDVFKSSNVSIGIAFLTSSEFRVLVQPRNEQNNEYIDVNGQYQTSDGKLRASVFDFEVKSPNARIRINNTGLEDATISSFTITHHQAGGVSQ